MQDSEALAVRSGLRTRLRSLLSTLARLQRRGFKKEAQLRDPGAAHRRLREELMKDDEDRATYERSMREIREQQERGE